MAIKFTIWPYLKYTKRPSNIPTSSIIRLSKIFPKWDFGFENIPSGNPDSAGVSSQISFLLIRSDTVYLIGLRITRLLAKLSQGLSWSITD
jgi:hypothetical protein